MKDLASAFVVAAIVTIIYEYLLHNKRESMIRKLIDEHREHMFQALKVHLLLTPYELFDLLANIAKQTKEVPTLYHQHEHPMNLLLPIVLAISQQSSKFVEKKSSKYCPIGSNLMAMFI